MPCIIKQSINNNFARKEFKKVSVEHHKSNDQRRKTGKKFIH